MDVDSHWYYEVLSLGLIEILDHKVDNGVEGSFQAIAEMIDTGQSLCPTINVQDNGDVVFGLP